MTSKKNVFKFHQATPLLLPGAVPPPPALAARALGPRAARQRRAQRARLGGSTAAAGPGSQGRLGKSAFFMATSTRNGCDDGENDCYDGLLLEIASEKEFRQKKQTTPKKVFGAVGVMDVLVYS